MCCGYYNITDEDVILCEIEATGKIIEGDDKCATNKIKIIRKIEKDEIYKLGNTGYRNTGYWNTGNSNTGNSNTGNWNTGNSNTGNSNTGNWNTGNWNTGDLNTSTPKVRLFNKETTIEFGSAEHYEYTEILTKYSKPLCEWVSTPNMTEQEKKENPTHETTQGYLKVNGICAIDGKVSQEDEAILRALPNFDEEILKQCTGIDLSLKTVKISYDGKEIQISRECFEQIKAQFID